MTFALELVGYKLGHSPQDIPAAKSINAMSFIRVSLLLPPIRTLFVFLHATIVKITTLMEEKGAYSVREYGVEWQFALQIRYCQFRMARRGCTEISEKVVPRLRE